MAIEHLQNKVWAGEPVTNNDLASALKELWDLDVATLDQAKKTNGRVNEHEVAIAKIKTSWLWFVMDMPGKIKGFLLFLGGAPVVATAFWGYQELSTTIKNHRSLEDVVQEVKKQGDEERDAVATNQKEIVRLMKIESDKQDKADEKH
jgi:hypothetical protein